MVLAIRGLSYYTVNNSGSEKETMNSRERVLAAIRHELSDRIPVDAITIEPVAEIAAYLGLPQEDVLPRLGVDGRVVAPAYQGAVAPPVDDLAMNDWGTPNSGLYGYGTHRYFPLAQAATVSAIEHYRWWPNSAQYDYAGAATRAHELREYAVRGPYWRPLFCGVCNLFGSELAMTHLLLEPALFEAALEGIFQRVYDYCQRFVAACGDHLAIFCLGDDFATQRGLMISPQLWRRYLKPRYARLFEIGQRADKPIWFHSCGDITAVLPDLLDIGMNVWETVQLHTLPLSPAELERQYGQRLTFFGGINTQRLPFITPEEVRMEVRSVIGALGEGGGYICGPDHAIKPDVPPQNIWALFQTATTFRQEHYTLSR
jgi:uroporphyrinogen decarboxylase